MWSMLLGQFYVWLLLQHLCITGPYYTSITCIILYQQLKWSLLLGQFSVWLLLQHLCFTGIATSLTEYYLNRGAPTLLTWREVKCPLGGPAHGAVTAVLSGQSSAVETLSPPVPDHSTDCWYGLLPATQNIGTTPVIKDTLQVVNVAKGLNSPGGGPGENHSSLFVALLSLAQRVGFLQPQGVHSVCYLVKNNLGKATCAQYTSQSREGNLPFAVGAWHLQVVVINLVLFSPKTYRVSG